MRRYTDELGNEVRLTDDRLRHILRGHPEMAFQLHRFAETLPGLDAVRGTDYSFILTSYLGRSIKGD